MARDIPGFYYDEQKGKYFKIEADHVAPKDARHSASSVRAEREQKQAAREAAEAKRLQSALCITRASILNDARSGSLLREVDLSPLAPRRVPGTTWAGSLGQQERIALDWGGQIHTLTEHKPTGTLVAAKRMLAEVALTAGDLRAMDAITTRTGIGVKTRLRSAEAAGAPTRPFINWAYYEHGVVSGISISNTESPVVLSTTFSSGVSASKLQLPGEDGDDSDPDCASLHPMMSWAPLAEDGSIEPIAAVRFAPAGAGPVYALASGAELRVSRVDPLGRGDPPPPTYYFATPDSDVLAVDWLTPAVALGGCRNGAVGMVDRRVPYRGAADRPDPLAPTGLRARGPVAHLRVLDAWRLLAAGPAHGLHMYDLRYARAPPSGRTAAVAPSAPYLSYPAYVNKAHIGLGFDVSPVLGLVAAATDDRRVRIFDLWNGAEVPGALGARRWNDQVPAVAFVRDEVPTDAEHPGLTIAADGALHEWGIGGSEEDG